MSNSKVHSAVAAILLAIMILPFLASAGEIEVEPFSWKEVNTTEDPEVKICGLMTYDSESDVSLMYGGFDGTAGSPDVWAFDFETGEWTDMQPDPEPPGRFGQGWVYDPSRDVCLMFFGVSGDDYYNDTWEYDYNTNTWTQLFPESSPTPRCKGGCSYDMESDLFIFYGGFGNDSVNMDETWTFDYDENTWTNRTKETAPEPRMRCPMIYDESSDHTILFGGWLGGTDVLGDTWAYDANTHTWENMDPSVSPVARARYGRAYLPKDEVVMITHGWAGEDGDKNDTWTYDYDTNTWTEMDIQGEPMEKRHCFQMSLDTESGLFVVYGGSGEVSYDNTWIFNPYEAQEEETDGLSTIIIIAVVLVILIIIVFVVIRLMRMEE